MTSDYYGVVAAGIVGGGLILVSMILVVLGIVNAVSGAWTEPSTVLVQRVLCPAQEKPEPVACAMTVRTYRPEALGALKKFRLQKPEAAEQAGASSGGEQTDRKIRIEVTFDSKEQADGH